MPTPIENELGLGPLTHRIRHWLRRLLARLGLNLVPQDRRCLDPLTVNYAAWQEVRRNVREWPHYKEAPNGVEVLVSPEDWEDYWGIDSKRKEAAISAYVRVRASKKGFWMSGKPQVVVTADDSVEVGEVEVSCQFVEPAEEDGSSHDAVAGTAEHDPLHVDGSPAPTTNDAAQRQPPTRPRFREQGGLQAQQQPPAHMPAQEPAAPRYLDPAEAGEACLVGARGFRLRVRSGDCIGAVRTGEEVSPEVNVRLDAEGFPYVDAKQCTIGVLEGRWTITNHSVHGTKVITKDGARLMLGEPVPYALQEGDTIYLGPRRPVRFEVA